MVGNVHVDEIVGDPKSLSLTSVIRVTKDVKLADFMLSLKFNHLAKHVPLEGLVHDSMGEEEAGCRFECICPQLDLASRGNVKACNDYVADLKCYKTVEY